MDELTKAHKEKLLGIIALAQFGEINKREFVKQLFDTQMTAIKAAFSLGGGDVDSDMGRKYIESQEKIHRKAARGIWKTIKRGDFAI